MLSLRRVHSFTSRWQSLPISTKCSLPVLFSELRTPILIGTWRSSSALTWKWLSSKRLYIYLKNNLDLDIITTKFSEKLATLSSPSSKVFVLSVNEKSRLSTSSIRETNSSSLSLLLSLNSRKLLRCSEKTASKSATRMIWGILGKWNYK